MKIIESFRSKENRVDYSKYYYTGCYLKKCFQDAISDSKEEIANAMGYDYSNPRKKAQFREVTDKMNNLEADSPLLYLELIKADINIIKLCLEEDISAYKRELEIPRFPLFASFKLTACFFGSLTFPEGTSENEVIELCKENLETKPFTHVIEYKNFYRIFISKDIVIKVTFEPNIRFTRKTMVID